MSVNELDAVFGLSKRPRSRPQASGPQEGTVLRTTADGVFFRLLGYSDTLEFGPAKWTRPGVEPGGTDVHDHTGTTPQPGQDCLVVFVGPGIQRPWVLGWW